MKDHRQPDPFRKRASGSNGEKDQGGSVGNTIDTYLYNSLRDWEEAFEDVDCKPFLVHIRSPSYCILVFLLGTRILACRRAHQHI